MKTILTLLLLTVPGQAKESTARTLELLEMRTRQLKPFNGVAESARGKTIGSYRYVSPRYNARAIRQAQRYRQNAHRRQWAENRRKHRFERARRR